MSRKILWKNFMDKNWSSACLKFRRDFYKLYEVGVLFIAFSKISLTCVKSFFNYVTRNEEAKNDNIVNHHVANRGDEPMRIVIVSQPNIVTS